MPFNASKHGCLPPAGSASKSSVRRLARAGFTLLEMMVAIAIAAFTVAALYATFTVQSRQLIVQDLHMEMHQNLRFATEMITRSARLAGYGSSGYIYGLFGPNGASDHGSELPAVIPWNDPNSTGPDAVTLVYAMQSPLEEEKQMRGALHQRVLPVLQLYKCFLSHYKLQCAAEARVLKTYLEAEFGKGTVFLDSDCLHDLRKLMDHLKQSGVIVVMQTQGIFERPWYVVRCPRKRQSNQTLRGNPAG